VSDGGEEDSNLVMDMERLSPAPPPAWQSGGGSSSGGEGDSSPDSRRRRRVIPVEDHLELANAVLNSAGPRINCPIDDDEDDVSQKTTTTGGAPYQSGRGIGSTTTSIICK
jgi:hypothetical protein